MGLIMRFRAAAAVFAIVSGLAVPTTHAAAAEDSPSLMVVASNPDDPDTALAANIFFQFNMCGVNCNAGLTDVADAVARSIVSHHALWVSLNEACSNQVQEVVANVNSTYATAGLGDRYVYRMVVAYNTSQCPSGFYGNAVLYDTYYGTEVGLQCWHLYPNAGFASGGQCGTTLSAGPSVEERSLICVALEVQYELNPGGIVLPLHQQVVCSAHLTAGTSGTDDSTRYNQGIDVSDDVGSYTSCPGNHCTGYVVVMGDFNQVPTSYTLDMIYRANAGDSAGYGQFHEVVTGLVLPRVAATAFPTDQDGRKIDYIFFGPAMSVASWQVTHPTVCNDGTPVTGTHVCSDHLLLFGEIY